MVLQNLRIAISVLLLFTALTGVLYPLLVTGVAQLVFPTEANGSLIVRDGRALGSELIGQQFTSSRFFWSRLSATGPMPYNAAASSGSNYGPLNEALLGVMKGRVDELRMADSANVLPIPVDLVTASGSGLDPHISVASALYQVPRVALERGIGVSEIQQLVDRFTEPRMLGFLGESRVNVLLLNLALDSLQSSVEGAQ